MRKDRFKVCLQYSMKRSHVVESGNLWAVVNELYEWFRDQIEPGQPLVLSVHPQAMAWMITGDHEDERAVKIVRKTLKDAIAFGFIELVYPRTRPLSYRWLGAVVDGEIRPNMEAWHRECAKTVAKLAQERRLRSVKNKYERLAWNMRLSRHGRRLDLACDRTHGQQTTEDGTVRLCHSTDVTASTISPSPILTRENAYGDPLSRK